MVCNCATAASELLNFTQLHFVAIILHAETKFIGHLFLQHVYVNIILVTSNVSLHRQDFHITFMKYIFHIDFFFSLNAYVAYRPGTHVQCMVY